MIFLLLGMADVKMHESCNMEQFHVIGSITMTNFNGASCKTPPHVSPRFGIPNLFPSQISYFQRQATRVLRYDASIRRKKEEWEEDKARQVWALESPTRAVTLPLPEQFHVFFST
jgi:hypothetical protein